MQLRQVPLSDPAAAPLLDSLRQAYSAWYGGPDDVAPAEFEPPGGAFLVLVDDTGATIAGGGFRRVDDEVCEVKRVWTAPEHRRHGHASRVLGTLERLARERGYRRIRLETGPAQPEAVAMYRGQGYRHTPEHAHYPSALAFEKRLTATRATVRGMTHATKDELDRLGELIGKARIGLLTTVDHDGRLVSRPMAVQEREFDGDLWFFTEDPSHKTTEVRANPEVNVALESGKGWVSLSGTAEVVRDQAKIDELWSTSAQAWFEQGREDPVVALLKVTAHSAEYWTSDEPRPVVLLKYAKAAVAGGQPHVGESHTVDLEG